jgi:hypothetical protein
MKNWNRWTAGVLSGFALVTILAACESKKDETSQVPADRSMAAGPSDSREAPVAPVPETNEARPGATKPEKPGAAG